MKVFELNFSVTDEKAWIAANTNIEALQTYCDIRVIDLKDLEKADEITEVPKEKWAEMIIENTDFDPENPEDDWEKMTFEEYMKTCQEPYIIASTEEI